MPGRRRAARSFQTRRALRSATCRVHRERVWHLRCDRSVTARGCPSNRRRGMVTGRLWRRFSGLGCAGRADGRRDGHPHHRAGSQGGARRGRRTWRWSTPHWQGATSATLGGAGGVRAALGADADGFADVGDAYLRIGRASGAPASWYRARPAVRAVRARDALARRVCPPRRLRQPGCGSRAGLRMARRLAGSHPSVHGRAALERARPPSTSAFGRRSHFRRRSPGSRGSAPISRAADGRIGCIARRWRS
jgi:hypothetical protein